MVRRRSARSIGLEIVPLGPGALSALLQALRDNRIVCLLSDRDLSGDGIDVEFFGERTTLPGGPATLALRTGATLLPAAVYFRPGRNHDAVVRPPVPVTREGRLREDVERITQTARARVRSVDPGRTRAMALDAAELAERPRGVSACGS